MENSKSVELNLSNDDPELLEKVVDHFTARIRAGEFPSISSYQERFPEQSEEIEDLLSSVAMIEQLKPGSATLPSNRPSLDKVSSLKRVGNYKIIREVGRGGMGVVFEAVHESLGRRVAIKVMPTPLVNSQKYVDRFEREAKSAAKLHHTNIVSVFGVGQESDFHYYVMDFVDGQTLSQIVGQLSLAKSESGSPVTARASETALNIPVEKKLDSSEPVSADIPGIFSGSQGSGDNLVTKPSSINKQVSKQFRWTAKIGAALADALSYAHQNKILHRDIKPANMVLDRNGVVWITDFGLAKDSSSELNLTKTGDVIGTPQYLAPESLEGKYDQRSEVYCLGLTLYELATLRPAFPNGSTAEVIRAIASTTPTAPRKINPRIPIDLSTIIEKSISKDPALRYQTARQLYSDLLAFVEKRPITARPPSTLENVIKWGRRNPLAAGLACVSTLLLSLVAVSASIGYVYTTDALSKEAQQRQLAETEKERAESEKERAESNVEIALEAFDEMFTQVVARGSAADIDIEGFEELMGVETTVTREDSAFLKKLLEFYDRFATENADNASLRQESARALRRAGNIYQLVGDYDLANNAYQKSVKVYQQLFDDASDSKEFLISLVRTKTEFSKSLRRIDQAGLGAREARDEARKQNEEAIALMQGVPIDKLDDDLKFEFAKTLNTLGASHTLNTVLASKTNGPRRQFGRLGMLQSWFGPQNDGRPESQGESGSRRGGQQGQSRDPHRNKDRPESGGSRRGGMEHRPGEGPRRGGGGRGVGHLIYNLSTRSLELLDELVNASPENIKYRSARANTYCSLAVSLLRPEPAKAKQMREQAISELEALIDIAPDNPSYRFRLAMACLLGDSSNSNAEQDENEKKLFGRAYSLTEELTEQFPDMPDYHWIHAAVCTQNANALIRQGQLKGALDSLQKTKTSLDRLGELLPAKANHNGTHGALRDLLKRLQQAARRRGDSDIIKAANQLMNEIPNQGQDRFRQR